MVEMSKIRLNPLALSALAVVCIIVIYHISAGSLGSSKNVSMKELLAVSVDLAERGGLKVKEVKYAKSLNAASKGLTKEGKKELKTDGDMQSHIALTRGFYMYNPSLTVISEEHESGTYLEVATPKIDLADSFFQSLVDEQVPIDDITVWIDPLDATQEYTENLDEYVTVMVCVAVKGKPVMGVIHRPLKSASYPSETRWVWVGHGSSDGLATLPNSSTDTTVIVSRSHSGNVKEVAEEAIPNVKVVPAGGAGYKALEVVLGKASLYAHVTRIKKWDICAGNAFMDHFHGKMTTLSGEDIDYSAAGSPLNDGGLLAAVKHHADYLEKLGPSFKKMKEKGSH